MHGVNDNQLQSCCLREMQKNRLPQEENTCTVLELTLAIHQ